MTIKEIKEETIEQRCDNCGNIQEMEIDELALGVVVEEHTIPNVIRLPTCNQCSTTEYLFVSKDIIQGLMSSEYEEKDGMLESAIPETSKQTEEIPKSPHQLLVDQLAERIAIRHQ
jgi:hypothetical protein